MGPYTTIEAQIKHGHILPLDPDGLPDSGRVLITILASDDTQRPDWDEIKSHLGKLKLREDPAAWQRRIRAEWDDRSCGI